MIGLISSAFTTPYCSATALDSLVVLAVFVAAGGIGCGIWLGARKLYGRGVTRWEGGVDGHELD